MRASLYLGLAFGLMLAVAQAAWGADAVEGKDFIWIDLGETNEEFHLSQKEQVDGVTKPAEVGGVECRENPWPYGGPGHNHIYFDIDDAWLMGGDTEVWIVMEYFDSPESQQINCQYDSNGAGPVGGAFRGAADGAFPMLKPTGTEKWLIHVWHITDGQFANRANGADFRFTSHGQGPIWINRVWLSLVEPPDPFDPEAPFGKPRAVSSEGKAAVTWAELKKTSL